MVNSSYVIVVKSPPHCDRVSERFLRRQCHWWCLEAGWGRSPLCEVGWPEHDNCDQLHDHQLHDLDNCDQFYDHHGRLNRADLGGEMTMKNDHTHDQIDQYGGQNDDFEYDHDGHTMIITLILIIIMIMIIMITIIMIILVILINSPPLLTAPWMRCECCIAPEF